MAYNIPIVRKWIRAWQRDAMFSRNDLPYESEQCGERNRNITKARLHLYDPSIDVSSLFFSCPGSFLASNMREAFLYHVTDPWRNLKECYIVSINKSMYSAKQRSFLCFYFHTEHWHKEISVLTQTHKWLPDTKITLLTFPLTLDLIFLGWL